MKTKLFTGKNLDIAINNWLSNNKVNVIDIKYDNKVAVNSYDRMVGYEKWARQSEVVECFSALVMYDCEVA